MAIAVKMRGGRREERAKEKTNLVERWGNWTTAKKVGEQDVVMVGLEGEKFGEAAGFGAGVVSHAEERG